MKLTINVKDTQIDELLTDIFMSFPEYATYSWIRCTGWKYRKWEYKFEIEKETPNFGEDSSFTMEKVDLERARIGFQAYLDYCMENEREVSFDAGSYCCLGVLAHKQGLLEQVGNGAPMGNLGILSEVDVITGYQGWYDAILPVHIEKSLGLTIADTEFLMRMNDDTERRYSFNKIADWIEANL